MHVCKRKEQGLGEIKEEHEGSEKGRGSFLNSEWSLNIYLCRGEKWLFDSITLL